MVRLQRTLLKLLMPDTACSIMSQTSTTAASDAAQHPSETQPTKHDLQEPVLRLRKELELLAKFSQRLLAELKRRKDELRSERGRCLNKPVLSDFEQYSSDGTSTESVEV
jgi:hypothetical protein